MSKVESYVAFFPRFTTLRTGSFTSIPLDVSQFGGVQMQVLLAGLVWGGEESSFKMYMEESLDGVKWPESMMYEFDLTSLHDDPALNTKFFSVAFRLRWFRVRIEIVAIPLLTLYVEGIMRAGGGGAREWTAAPRAAAKGPHGMPVVKPQLAPMIEAPGRPAGGM